MEVSRTFRLTTDSTGAGIYTNIGDEKLALDADDGGGVNTPPLKGWFLYELEFVNPVDADKLAVAHVVEVFILKDDAEKQKLFYHKVTSSVDVPSGPYHPGYRYMYLGASDAVTESIDQFVDYQPEQLRITVKNDGGTATEDRYIDVIVSVSTNTDGCSSKAGLPTGFK